MVNYDFIIDAERCNLPLTGNPGKYVEVTLARASYCGKLGLTHYEDEFPDVNELSDDQIASLLGEKPKKKAFLGDYDDEDY